VTGSGRSSRVGPRSAQRADPGSRATAGEVSRLFERGGHALTADQARALEAYLSLLFRWSSTFNLTGFRGAEAAAEGLLFDATVVAPLLPEGGAILDVGAGAGGLAIALRVLRPDLALRLVEARAKRAAFLRAVRRELGLDRFEVIEARAEALGRRDADAAYARAVLPPREWVRLGAALVRPNGLVLCLSAAPVDPAIVPGDAVLVAERRYALPASGAERVVSALRIEAR
jgi:16S rRNA (guanine527-N7)-methyltransferase